MKSGEKLVLVERFEELRTGMRVVVNPCSWCQGTHYGIVGDFVEGFEIHNPDGTRSLEACFDYIVANTCPVPDDGLTDAISAGDVSEHRVFRFAPDLNIDNHLAVELTNEGGNPYMSRSVVGTAGRDELVKVRR